MPMATALSLCPETIRRPGSFSCYRDVSRKVMNIFSEFTTLVEPVSLDGACMDVMVAVSPGQGAANISRRPINRVKAELGLTISVGVATGKFVAKIASEIDKPDGFRVVSPGSERELLRPH